MGSAAVLSNLLLLVVRLRNAEIRLHARREFQYCPFSRPEFMGAPRRGVRWGWVLSLASWATCGPALRTSSDQSRSKRWVLLLYLTSSQDQEASPCLRRPRKAQRLRCDRRRARTRVVSRPKIKAEVGSGIGLGRGVVEELERKLTSVPEAFTVAAVKSG